MGLNEANDVAVAGLLRDCAEMLARAARRPGLSVNEAWEFAQLSHRCTILANRLSGGRTLPVD